MVYRQRQNTFYMERTHSTWQAPMVYRQRQTDASRARQRERKKREKKSVTTRGGITPHRCIWKNCRQKKLTKEKGGDKLRRHELIMDEKIQQGRKIKKEKKGNLRLHEPMDEEIISWSFFWKTKKMKTYGGTKPYWTRKWALHFSPYDMVTDSPAPTSPRAFSACPRVWCMRSRMHASHIRRRICILLAYEEEDTCLPRVGFRFWIWFCFCKMSSVIRVWH